MKEYIIFLEIIEHVFIALYEGMMVGSFPWETIDLFTRDAKGSLTLLTLPPLYAVTGVYILPAPSSIRCDTGYNRVYCLFNT